VSMADERFIPLAELLRPPVVPQSPPPPPLTPAVREDVVCAEATPAAHDDLLRDVRLFRARLADAFDAMRERLLVALAGDVVARELRLAPVDIAALARRLLDERTDQGPIRLRVAPEDLERVRCAACAVVADSTLLAGDAVLECEGGDVDARLGVRLADALRGLQ